MRIQIWRLVMLSLCLVMVAHAGACLPPPLGVRCGDRWCPEDQKCGPDVGLQQEVCVAAGHCGNGIPELDVAEECDCGSDPILASSASCAGQPNSNTSGWCNEECKLNCGDGRLEVDEACDTKLPIASSCIELGYDFGRPGCSASCKAITVNSCKDWTWRPVDIGVHDTFNAIWGSQPDDIWVSGITTTLHYDGVAWSSRMEAPHLFDMWGSGPHDIFGLEADASDIDRHGQVIWHYDGTGWAVVHRDTDRLAAIWGTQSNGGPREVFVVKEPTATGMDADAGVDGNVKLLHCNVSDCTDTDASKAWNEMPTQTTERQRAIWGRGPSDVFTVGDSGVIQHYKGGGWTGVTAPDQHDLHGIWGSADGDIYVVGDGGTLLHSTGDGSSWNPIDTHIGIGSSNLVAVWGSGSDDIFVAADNSTVLHFDGGSWQLMTHHTDSFPSRIWGTGRGDVYATSFGTAMRHYDGTDLELVAPSVFKLKSVLVYGENSALALASIGTSVVVRYDGSSWQQLSESSAGGVDCLKSSAIMAIFDCSGRICFIDNLGGVAAYRDQNSSAQCLMRDSLTWAPAGWQMTSVWSTSGSVKGSVDIYAAGSDGIVMYNPGSSLVWQQIHTGVNVSLLAIWGSGPRDIYAVGEDGAVVHYDGNRWQPLMPGSGQIWRAVWGSGPDDVYVAGENNASAGVSPIMHFDGDRWQPLNSGTTQAINAVWGSGPRDVYAVGDAGLLLHNDGEGWQPMRSGETLNLFGITGDPTGRTHFIMGDSGRIYRMTIPR